MKTILLGHDASGLPVTFSPEERETHMHIIGSSGSGKSKFLEQMMRGDLANGQGFCLIDPHGSLYNDVLSYSAHKVLNREIVLLNLSEPSQVIGFNPFRKAPDGDVSVQVDRRIRATMHAWGVENADQTPTLERTLRLIFTTLLELGLSFHQAQHLINFQSGEIREQLVERLTNPLIRQEWEELLALKPKDWRAEMLSSKNRLFRLLTSETLGRFLNASAGAINLEEIIEKGKVLLVNLAPSKHFSDENGRVFGALLVNEFFEVARRRPLGSGTGLRVNGDAVVDDVVASATSIYPKKGYPAKGLLYLMVGTMSVPALLQGEQIVIEQTGPADNPQFIIAGTQAVPPPSGGGTSLGANNATGTNNQSKMTDSKPQTADEIAAAKDDANKKAALEAATKQMAPNVQIVNNK